MATTAILELQLKPESIEHDRAYRAWRATPEGKSGLGPILAAPPKLTQFTVAEGV